MSLADLIRRSDELALRKLEKKLPSWAGAGVCVPASLNLEQCSSEVTAVYKAGLIQEGARVADLTGGLGADSWAFSRRASAVWYNERNAALLEAVRNNFRLLGVDNAEFNGFDVSAPEGEWRDALRRFGPDVVYLDPARRNAAGSKVFLPEECSPDFVSLMPALLQIAPRVMVKVSPMADITMLRRRLEGVLESVHVVGAGGECKELLCLCARDASYSGVVLAEDGFVFYPDCSDAPQKESLKTSASLHPSRCASLAGPSRLFEMSFPPVVPQGTPSLRGGHGRPRFSETPSDSASLQSCLLFVPSAAMVKSGLGPGMCLMEYDDELAHFGTFWQVVENLPFASSVIKSIGRRYPKAEVTARGVPVSSEELRKKTGTKPGGSVHIFACSFSGDRRILICLPY